MHTVCKPDEEPGRIAASLDVAAHFHGMADSFARFNEVARKHLASGKPTDFGLLSDVYAEVSEVLR